MILVDTSVWIRHLRSDEPALRELLEEESVLTHPFVLGEIALGRLDRRTQILALLENLPAAKSATHQEVLELIEQRDLAGSGIGWVDVHLLASALLSGVPLWTEDKSLLRVAGGLGISA